MSVQTTLNAEGESVEEHIIRLSKLSYERLPMMEVVFERYLLTLAPAIKSLCAAATEVTLDDFAYLSCGEALEGLASPSFLAVTETDSWDGPVLLAVEPELLFSVLEILLGGRSARAREWTPRSFTAIEKRIGTRLCETALSALSESFAQLNKVDFRIDRLESLPQSTMLAAPSTPCVRVTLNVRLEDRGGRMSFVLPYNAFESVRPLFTQSFLGGQLGGDSSWRALLTDKLQETEVTLAAVLHEVHVPLTQVLDWAPGQTLDLGILADQAATVSCNGMVMFRGEMGRRRNGAIALKITEELAQLNEGHDDEHAD
ncbi:hypothetical protein EKE94_16170 [Mesobaculum littorinae]|uniref:Flagellar motor switch protein FliM n=1 Tax=Mesobaculum littorinae TaxID=2486419 RepID=A0A438ADW7_9RHOB|nr:FliM/FliN family flagellar motor switch protein [Mesobaculum littorinae]RVV96879.1 hypothetical protein EKE94_16170 [Mesobaculum littorinae]